mgnify:CR=1 FL=1
MKFTGKLKEVWNRFFSRVVQSVGKDTFINSMEERKDRI